MKRLLLLLLVCGLPTACTTSPTGRSQLMLISPESAIVESKKAYLSTVGELNKKDKLANDPALSKHGATGDGRYSEVSVHGELGVECRDCRRTERSQCVVYGGWSHGGVYGAV